MSELPGLRLDELLRELAPGSELSGDGSVRVQGVRQDSRRVAPGDLFVALKGARSDGGSFVEAALAKGAVAVLTDRDSKAPPGLPAIRVSDTRAALALASAAVYGHPGFALDIVGITGTNGKTTTAHLVRSAIDAALGRTACGLIGTVGHSFDGLSVAAEHTTPEADDLARILSAMRGAGATHAAMEVSSIALSSRRVQAIRFRVAAFTNLTRDHLDYHGTMEQYAEAKAELFTTFAPGSAVINVDDPFGRELVSRVQAPLVRVSARLGVLERDADIAPLGAQFSMRGIQARVRTPAGVVDLESPLCGAHNLENLLVTLGVVAALGLDVETAAATLRDERGAPGRLERCDSAGDDIHVLVDYAHTPDALDRVLRTVRELTTGRVIVVFGCGGDRDRTKRGPMGEAAGRGADIAIVTNDNPRGESPEAIAGAVVEGLRGLGLEELRVGDVAGARRGYFVELDRARAILSAVSAAVAGDTVVVCGKGHEAYQVVGVTKAPFDDRTEARRALSERRERAARRARGAG